MAPGDPGAADHPREGGELAALTEPLPDMLLLDVREPAEFAAGHLPGSLNIPLAAVLAGEAVADDRPVLVICRSGARATVAAAALAARGHRVHVLEGGLLGLDDPGNAGSRRRNAGWTSAQSPQP